MQVLNISLKMSSLIYVDQQSHNQIGDTTPESRIKSAQKLEGIATTIMGLLCLPLLLCVWTLNSKSVKIEKELSNLDMFTLILLFDTAVFRQVQTMGRI